MSDGARALFIDQLRAALRADLGELIAKASAPWLSVNRAARYSGLGVRTIRRLLSSGRLTAHRPCRGRVLVDRQQLDNLIASSTTTLRKGRGRRTTSA